MKSRCDDGFTGVVCAICKTGYYLSDDYCLECPKSKAESEAIIVLVFGSLLLMFLIALCRTMHVKDSKAHWRRASRSFLDSKSAEARSLDRQQLKNFKQLMQSVSAALKSFIGFVQILSVSDTAFDIPWPEGFLDLLRFTTPFNFDFISVSGVGCLVKYDFFDSFRASMLMPAAVILVVFFVYVARLQMYKAKHGNNFNRAMRDTFTNRALNFTMWIILLIYPPVRCAIHSFSLYEHILHNILKLILTNAPYKYFYANLDLPPRHRVLQVYRVYRRQKLPREGFYN